VASSPRACSAVLLAILGACHTSRSSPRSPSEPALVSPAEALIRVPVRPRPSWSWLQPETEQDALEYGYQARVVTPTGAYEFGYSLWKGPKSGPVSGDLTQLLQAGQATLWSVADGHGIRQPADVRVWVEGDTVVIALRGRDAVTRVFGARPTTLTLEWKEPGLRFRRQSVPVTYSAH
jgi:hypothetical protein